MLMKNHHHHDMRSKSNPTASLTDAPIDADHTEKHTGSLCRDIARAFRHRSKTNAQAKKDLIAKTRRWVERLSKQLGTHSRVAERDGGRRSKRPRMAAKDALAALLRSLDDVDAENLSRRSRRGDDGTNERIDRPKRPPPSVAREPRKRRRRLPPDARSIDVVRAMHEAGGIDSDEGGCDSRKFYLSNSDRYRRAKRSHSESLRGCSMIGVSLKAVMNARLPDGDSEDAITTLTHEAAVLRRDLYKCLAAGDTAEIKAMMQKEGTGKRRKSDGKFNSNHALPMIKDMASALSGRIASNPTSPSMRLSAVIALDSLRELDLSDRGYRSISDELLDANAPWSMKFYAEIVSECSAYEKPRRLLLISELLRRALEGRRPPSDDDCDAADEGIPSLLRAISHIMVRRRSVLSGFDRDDAGSPPLRRYRHLCNGLSVRYDSVANWITPTMPSDIRESVISALQAEGVLSLFCYDDSDDEGRISTSSSQSLQTTEPFPYPQWLSLRAAHDRMGPCDGFTRLLSHPAVYERDLAPPDPSAAQPSIQPSTEEDVACPFSSAHDDMLRIVFSFLGHRSLARASRCCKSWNRAGGATSLWAPLYFRKYRRAYFEEELLSSDDADGAGGEDDRVGGRFLSLRGAVDRGRLAASEAGRDWNYLFGRKRAAERGSGGARRTCDVVGCSYAIRRADHFRSHMKRHESAARARRGKRRAREALRRRVSELRSSGAPEPVGRARAPKRTTDGPDAVLERLVFPYLDFEDVVRPVCKLWTRIAKSDALWRSLYRHHFGAPNARSISCPTDDWKPLFRDALAAHRKVRGRFDVFGWRFRVCPVLGCNKGLHSELEYDYHVLKHEEAYHLSRIKRPSKTQRGPRRLVNKQRAAKK